MRTLSICCLLASVMLLVTFQARGQGAVQGEIVFPRQNIFTLGTTVSVPDRGGASLGGFGSRSINSSRAFPEFGRGFGMNQNIQNTTTRVWVFDFESMDPYWNRRGLRQDTIPQVGFAGAIQNYSGRSPAFSKKTATAAHRKRVSAINTEPKSAILDEGTLAIQRARQLEKAGEFASAYSQWVEVRSRHMAAANSTELVKAITRLKKTPEVQAAIKEPQAAVLLECGDRLTKEGKLDRARRMYEAAVKLVPARSAQVARSRLTTRSQVKITRN